MTEFSGDPLFQFPRTSFASSAGSFELPIFYYDNSNVIAMFWVDHARAQI